MRRAIFCLIFVGALASLAPAEKDAHVRLVVAPNREYAVEWTRPAGPLRIVSLRNPSAVTELAVAPLARAQPGRRSSAQLLQAMEAEHGHGVALEERVPLPFISADSNWIFVPSRDQQNDSDYFEGPAVLFHRIRSRDASIHFEPAMADRFDKVAWDFLAGELKIKDAETMADAHRAWSASFIDWSGDSGRLLVAVAGRLWSDSENGWVGASGYSLYAYFNTQSGQFELTDRLRLANSPERNQPPKDEATSLAGVVIDAESMGEERPQQSPQERFDTADKRLNEIYPEVLSQIEQAKREGLREEEREWLLARDMAAEIAVIQTWSTGVQADARELESKAISTEARVADLEKRLTKQ